MHSYRAESTLLWWSAITVASGAAALGYETVWLRRLSLTLGGSAIAAAITLATFMAGLGIGGWLARWLPVNQPARTYAGLETIAVVWALFFPWLLGVLPTWGGALMPIPAAMALGATWPLLTRRVPARQAVTLYAANTFGAVLGTLGTTFFALPWFGVRGAEIGAASLGALAALAALAAPPLGVGPAPDAARPRSGLLVAAGLAGLCALGMEVLWMRLAAVGLGATVQTFGLVLAVFLATMAAGSTVGRRWPKDPERGASYGLVALGICAMLGGMAWSWVPYGVAATYRILGPEGLWVGNLILSALVMGGAPAASGLVFANLTRAAARDGQTGDAGAWLYAANTAGAIPGALLGGLLLLPALGAKGSLFLFAGLAATAALAVERRPILLAGPALVLALHLLSPQWDGRLFATGVHLRISDFEDPSARAIEQFVEGEWDLLHYEQGLTGAVAVGQSRSSGNIWLSINGKVDASTGDDMPTQRMSGELPTHLAATPREVLVVGLASGVTAGAVLEDPRVSSLTLVELEPAVVRASHFFDQVNGRPLDDPRTRLVIDDARSFLLNTEETFDVIISEPSNPWITGVSSLFTEEYWRIARRRLATDGVFCQWVQLYGMGTEEFRGLVRTFQAVFPDTWLYTSIEGSDVLLIAGPPPEGLYTPVLDPDGVRRLGGAGWLNTDDRPRVEWQAPRYLHYATSERNSELIEASASRP